MRKYKIAVSPKLTWELDVDGWRDLGRGRFGLVRNLVSSFSFWLLIAFVVGLNCLLFAYSNFDSAVLAYGLALAGFLIGGWVALTLLSGWRYTIDPPLFVPVLIFALLTTTAYLLSPDDPFQPNNAANTFGVSGVKFISALGIITFIFLYYFINVYLYSRLRLHWFWRGVSLGMFLLPVWWIISTTTDLLPVFAQQTGIAINLAAVTVPAVLLFILFRRTRTWVSWVAIALLGLLTVISFQPSQSIWSKLVTAVVLLVIWGIWLVKGDFDLAKARTNLSDSFADLRKGKVGIIEFVQTTKWLWWLLFLLMWIVLTMVWAINQKVNVATVVSGLINDYRVSMNTLQDFKTILVGNGATARQTNATLADVISFHGLIGVVAYVFMAIAAILFGLRQVLNEFGRKQERSFYAWILWPILLGVGLLALVGKLNSVLVMWWWLIISFLSAYKLLEKRKFDPQLWATWDVKQESLRKALPILQILLICVIYLAAIALVNTLGSLLAQGTI